MTPQPASRSLSLEGGDGISLELELEQDLEGGRKAYRMKGATHAERGSLPGLPIQLLAPDFSFRSAPQATATETDPGEGRAKASGMICEGTASSTSKDWYGTEMDRGALESMARQFAAGVSLTPRHNGWMSPVEWDEVIGLTMEGTVRAADVSEPSAPDEQGYTLDIRAKLFEDEEKAQALARRLSAQQPIGLSIGGWFTDVRVMTDENDDVERIIVLGVALDHLAVTRSPANPDCTGLRLMRGMADQAVKKLAVIRSIDPGQQAADDSAKQPDACPDEGKRSEIADKSAPAQHDDGDDRATPTTEEPTMNPDEIKRIAADAAAEAATRAVMAFVQTQAKPAEAARSTEPAPAPAPATPVVDWEARAKAAESQNSVLQGRVREFAGASSNRRTIVPNHAYVQGHGEGSQIRSLAQAARDEGRALAVAEVSERFERTLGADRFDPAVKRTDLDACLRSLINAGIQDGIIKDPSAETTWT